MKVWYGILALVVIGSIDGRTRLNKTERAMVGIPTKLIKDMNFKEAVHAKTYYEKKNQSDLVTKALERMLVTNNNPYELKKVRLDLAKMYEQQEQPAKALKIYQEFTKMYPGSAEYEEAYAQSIKINFSLTNDYRRDQTKTHETIEMARTFLEEKESYQTWRPFVEDIISQCYEKLVDHDLYVCDQYITQFAYSQDEKDLSAARYRLGICQKKHQPHALKKVSAVQETEKLIDTLDPKKQPVVTTNDQPEEQKPDYLKVF